jgi:predicted enzyme related to lactoylglutathione lyase
MAHLSGITVDCVDPARLAAFWGSLLGLEEEQGEPGWVRFAASDTTPRLNFQRVAEPKIGKTRIHLDVTVADVGAGARRVAELGGDATGERHDYDEGVVVVMTDPEGNEFCLVQYF